VTEKGRQHLEQPRSGISG